jgi:hypothetical protein
MEADWEFEIGGDAPIIEAYWSGFVDLRGVPERAAELTECRDLPGLSDTLVRLNEAESPVWTSKVDVFTPERIDPDEMEASEGEADCALACYIDLLPRPERSWDDSLMAERACRQICACLREESLRCCRIDVVIRRALVADRACLGATVYFAACGRTLEEAKIGLGECLEIFVRTMDGLR